MKRSIWKLAAMVTVTILAASNGGLPARAQTQMRAVSAAASAYYYSVAGAAFNPENNTDPWFYTQNNCIQADDTIFFQASLHVPDGSVLKRMIFGYHNTPDDYGAPAYLYAYSLSGSSTLVATTTGQPGSTHPGYVYSEANIPDVVVDNLNYDYVLSWGGQKGQELCYYEGGISASEHIRSGPAVNPKGTVAQIVLPNLTGGGKIQVIRLFPHAGQAATRYPDEYTCCVILNQVPFAEVMMPAG